MTRILCVEYDVTGLDQAQIDALAEEAKMQGNASMSHPTVTVAFAFCGVASRDAVEAIALLRDYIASDRDVVAGLVAKMPEETQREYLERHDAALDAVDSLAGAVSAAAPVTAGPPPSPSALCASAIYRGVTGTVEIFDYPDDPEQFVSVRFFIDPVPTGLDRLVYSHQSVRVPEASDA